MRVVLDEEALVRQWIIELLREREALVSGKGERHAALSQRIALLSERHQELINDV